MEFSLKSSISSSSLRIKSLSFSIVLKFSICLFIGWKMFHGTNKTFICHNSVFCRFLVESSFYIFGQRIRLFFSSFIIVKIFPWWLVLITIFIFKFAHYCFAKIFGYKKSMITSYLLLLWWGMIIKITLKTFENFWKFLGLFTVPVRFSL